MVFVACNLFPKIEYYSFFTDLFAPRLTKWPKVNCQLKIVNYFTCVCYLFCK